MPIYIYIWRRKNNNITLMLCQFLSGQIDLNKQKEKNACFLKELLFCCCLVPKL